MLYITEYNPVSFVIRGDTKGYENELRVLGGKRNTDLSGGTGWLFNSRRPRENVMRFVAEVNEENRPYYPCLRLLTLAVLSGYIIGGLDIYINRIIAG